jgi:hypothetical protein
MVFDHPFLEKRFRREVYDISSSGFSVLERPDNAVLLPGMILRDFKLNFAGAFDLKCIMGQAVYSQKHDEKSVRCGFAILDMDLRTYSNLNNILGKSLDKNTEISNEVDLDELWKFLFETGFLYPDKYHHIADNSYFRPCFDDQGLRAHLDVSTLGGQID